MADRPINAKPHEVRAMLAGRKTMLRVPLKPQPFPSGYYDGDVSFDGIVEDCIRGNSARFSASAVGGGAVLTEGVDMPFVPGDRLWVRETFALAGDRALYRADPEYDGMSAGDFGWSWSPSSRMPRSLSRLTLLVEAVKVERLQEITEEGAVAEGIWPAAERFTSPGRAYGMYECRFPDGKIHFGDNAYELFRQLWDSLHTTPGHRWSDNPFVAAVRFAAHRCNIDALPAPEVARD